MWDTNAMGHSVDEVFTTSSYMSSSFHAHRKWPFDTRHIILHSYIAWDVIHWIIVKHFAVLWHLKTKGGLLFKKRSVFVVVTTNVELKKVLQP